MIAMDDIKPALEKLVKDKIGGDFKVAAFLSAYTDSVAIQLYKVVEINTCYFRHLEWKGGKDTLAYFVGESVKSLEEAVRSTDTYKRDVEKMKQITIIRQQKIRPRRWTSFIPQRTR